jgi:DNA repair protein RadD
MLFAATVQHAEEVFASLPHNSAIVHGGLTKEQIDAAIEGYKSQRIRYVVSVGKLTTGFDAPWTEIIALLRRSESAGLLTQMMGRAWRLYEGKETCLLLDYGDNVSTHFPDGDVYSPEITANPIKVNELLPVKCECPVCNIENEFSARPNPDEYQVSENGYFVDLAGNVIETDAGPIPAHYGRRCLGGSLVAGKWEQCSYRWTSKECPHCYEENDIAAKYCKSCKGEIIDPNEKLAIEFRALKRSPKQRQCDEVLKCDVKESVSTNGNETIRVDFVTPYRSFSIWLMKNPTNNFAAHALALWKSLKGETPKTVAYKKEENGFWRVLGYNMEIDKERDS